MKVSRNLLPSLADLQAFDAAARHGSFTRAAAELNLTQSAVSRQIKDLEFRFGVPLFERVRQRVVLSSAGRQLQAEARAILARVELMTLNAASSRDISGHLTIATLPTFGSRWMVPRLPNFLQQHPGLQISVVTRSEPFDMIEAGVDVAIHYGQPVWPGARCEYLCRETVVPVAARGSGLTIEDVMSGRAPLLHLSSRPMLWAEWMVGQGAEQSRGFPGHRFEQFSLLIEAVHAGLGSALIPTYLIERELAQGSLQRLHDATLDTDAGYYVVITHDRASDPVCRAFQDWMVCNLAR